MCNNNSSWSALYRHRRAAQARFGDLYQLPLAKRASDVVMQAARGAHTLLEVGAGDRRLAQKIAQYSPDCTYRSLDIDPEGEHDYRSFAQLDRTFDCVVALEVVEHLTLDEIRAWLADLYRALGAGGTLVLSTPNTYYPPAYLRDATHRTPLCYDELAGLLTAAGFEVTRILRIYNDPVPRKILRRYLLGWLFRALGLDYARQIVVVARK
jgi:2-polyprenyl-3-methyl-5-hydroxy-6-metoxy-1,4-benzoquinol methylase